MNILRLRLSSGINQGLTLSLVAKESQHYQGSAWILELVKVPLTIFDKNKSNTVSSISEVKDDVEQRVESAEASLSELRNAISRYRRCFCQSRGRRSNQSSLQGCLPCLQQAKQYSRVYDK